MATTKSNPKPAQDETIVDATVVDEPGTDLEPTQSHNLFRTDEPAQVLERATATADVLKDVLKSRGMIQMIQGKEHIKVEGWTTLGSMLGVVPVVEWTRQIPNGWEARVEARTLDGRVIGAAEAQCTRDERMWSKRDDYALRSMAQTRATSKALRGPLGFVVTLAGYEATPAEEIPADTASQSFAVDDFPRAGSGKSDVTPDIISKDQVQALSKLYVHRGKPEAVVLAWLKENAPDTAGETLTQKLNRITPEQGAALMDFLSGGGDA